MLPSHGRLEVRGAREGRERGGDLAGVGEGGGIEEDDVGSEKGREGEGRHRKREARERQQVTGRFRPLDQRANKNER